MPTDRLNITAGVYSAFAYETITVTDTAKSLTEATYIDSNGDFAKSVLITIEDDQIVYRYDGGTPTSSVGHTANPFDSLTLRGTNNIKNFKVIRKGSNNATIKVTYEL